MCSKPIYDGPKVIDTETFLQKAHWVHGDTYDYSKVEYETAIKKITIICKKHGEFKQTPNNHLNGKRCLHCSMESSSKKQSQKSRESLIRRFREVHGDKYDYSKSEYVNSKTKITIVCHLHGDFQQTPSNHIKGVDCPICGTEKAKKKSRERRTKTLIEDFRKVHGNRFLYDKVDYINQKTKVTATCPNHGDFELVPKSHLKGSVGCAGCLAESLTKLRKPFTYFMEEVEKSGRSKKGYQYIEESYTGMHGVVDIVCPFHGVFSQRPYDHINGSGCHECGKHGHAISIIRKGETGKCGQLYVIRMSHDNESFIKVGISTKTKHRLNTLRKESMYNVEEILIRESTFYESAVLENIVHNTTYLVKYSPLHSFGGHTECYSEEALDDILDIISSN